MVTRTLDVSAAEADGQAGTRPQLAAVEIGQRRVPGVLAEGHLETVVGVIAVEHRGGRAGGSALDVTDEQGLGLRLGGRHLQQFAQLSLLALAADLALPDPAADRDPREDEAGSRAGRPRRQPARWRG